MSIKIFKLKAQNMRKKSICINACLVVHSEIDFTSSYNYVKGEPFWKYSKIKENINLVSIYRVYFKWKNKEISLSAKSLDLTHPYFVSIKDLIFPDDKKIIINPADEEIRKTFSKSKHLMIPFQTVILIEELYDKEHKIMPFNIKEKKD